MKIWSSLAILFVIALAGCGEGAKLLQEKEDGGVVAYPFIGEQGPMLSAFRTDALALIKEKCRGLYTKAPRKLCRNAGGGFNFSVSKGGSATRGLVARELNRRWSAD
jgi:hypothetical protein